LICLLPVARGDFRRLPSDKAIAQEAEHAKLLPPENVPAKGPHYERDVPEPPFPFLGDGKIHTRHDPRRSALKKVKFSGSRSDLRNKLDGACARADDSYILVIEFNAVIPSGRMKFWARKTLDALDPGILRDVQASNA
jgi:hypothetical protein